MAQPFRSMMAMLGSLGAVCPSTLLMRPRILLHQGSRILLTILLVAQMLGASGCVLLIEQPVVLEGPSTSCGSLRRT